MMDMWKKYLAYRTRFPGKFPSPVKKDPDETERAIRFNLGVMEEHPRWLWVRDWDSGAVRERPVYLDDQAEQQIEGYFALVERRPDLFAASKLLPLNLDRRSMLTFWEETDRPVGLVFDNGQYYKVVADLIDAPKPYAYARVLYPDAEGNGTVIIPRLLVQDGEPLFGILHLFRHTIRRMAGGEFPRGFQASGITPEENAVKELQEEFGVSIRQLTRLTLLGETRADTGLSSGQVQVYLADLTGPLPHPAVGEEGIAGAEWIRQSELFRRIRKGEILDGMTQTAVLLYTLFLNGSSFPGKPEKPRSAVPG